MRFQRSGSIQETFRKHSGKIQGTFNYLVLLPDKVLGVSVDGLHIPRHPVAAFGASALPDPTADAAVRAQRGIDHRLVAHHTLELIVRAPAYNKHTTHLNSS